MNNIKVPFRYQIIADSLGIVTVAFFMKDIRSANWNCCLIAAGESYGMLHKLEQFN